MWFVYILLCRDGSLYTGVTNNLPRRLKDHKDGKGGSYTRSHPPKKIIFSERARTRGQAQAREAAIKRLPRAKKLQLIRFHKS
ncbi:MAG: GIY-YIG nuclease family protein [Patescibacteria group bacterium]